MSTFLESPTCLQWVLSLGHFLWQGLLVGVLAWLGSLALRHGSSQARYRLHTATLIVLAACPLLTFVWLGHKPAAVRVAQRVTVGDRSSPPAAPSEHQPIAAPSDPVFAEKGAELAVDDEPISSEAETSGASATETKTASPTWLRLAPWLLTAYVAGVLAMLSRLLLGLRGGARLRRESQPVTEGTLLDLLAERSVALGIRAAPTLAWCRQVAVPTVVGVLRPAILLPLSLRSGMTPEQLAAILTHELAHIRRWDPLLNLFQRFVEAMLFFHPVVWIVSGQMRRERENCCDDLVLATGSDPSGYASALLKVARVARPADATATKPSLAALVAMGADGKPSELGGRIRRLLGVEPHAVVRLRHPGMAWAGIATVIALVALSQIAVNAEQDADGAQPNGTVAVLPNGVEVELVGVGFHPSADRPWWKPDGSPLEKRPYEKSGATVMPGSPEQAECREFRIEIRGLPSDHAVKTQYGSGAAASGSVYSEGLWIGDHAAGPFKTSTASIRIGIATEPLGPVQTIDAEGRKQALVGMTAEMKPLHESIVPLRVEESFDGFEPPKKGEPKQGTRLVFDATKYHSALEQAQWEIHAIDTEGNRQRSTFRSGYGDEQSIGFPIPRSRIARFEYRLRPYRYWVTFENVSLEPGVNTQVGVEVQAPETVSLDEWSRIIATRVATQLPFTSDTHRQQTAAEFRQLVKTHGPAKPDPQHFTGIRKALDQHMKLEFPDGPYPGAPGSIQRDEIYLKLPVVIQMLQWRLFMALQRSLDDDERSRLEEQQQWMRQFIRSLPEPPERFDRDGFATNRALAKLQDKFQDPLRAVFQEPLSENQFQAFQQAMNEFRGRLGDRAVLSVVHHLIAQYHRLAYRDREVPVPRLAAFDEPPPSVRIVSGRVQLMFPRAASFRGGSNTVADFYRHGTLIVLRDPVPGIVGFELDDTPDREAALGELDAWFAQTPALDRGHLIFDEQAMRLIGVRGTRLVPLGQRRFYEVDGLPTEQLVEKVKESGSRSWDFPDPVSEDPASGSKYDSLAAVLTGDDQWFVIQIQEHGPAGLRFHARRHHWRADAIQAENTERP